MIGMREIVVTSLFLIKAAVDQPVSTVQYSTVQSTSSTPNMIGAGQLTNVQGDYLLHSLLLPVKITRDTSHPAEGQRPTSLGGSNLQRLELYHETEAE